MRLTEYDMRAVNCGHRLQEALDNGITRSCYYARFIRGARPVEAASPDYRRRSRWDGVTTTAQLCRERGVNPRSVATWKRRHPDRGLSDAEVVAIVAANKAKRAVND